MPEKRTLLEKLLNRFYAIPAVAQWWGRRTATKTADFVDLSTGIPFARLRQPLSHCRVALLTTGGIHLPSQTPFDMENPDGDPTYREIPEDVDPKHIMITHKYYDHSDADADLNVIFPLQHFRDLVKLRVIGELNRRHFGLMGHIDNALVDTLNQWKAPEIAAKLRADGVDFAFLTPA
ncbi:MAG: glycine/sarcosine/betaine reductase selenoprotein B family protein [Caldilineaceae bacterium]